MYIYIYLGSFLQHIPMPCHYSPSNYMPYESENWLTQKLHKIAWFKIYSLMFSLKPPEIGGIAHFRTTWTNPSHAMSSNNISLNITF